MVTVKAQEVERWFRPLEAVASALADSPRANQETLALVRAGTSTDIVELSQAYLLASFDEVLQRTRGLQAIKLVGVDRKVLISTSPATVSFGIVPILLPAPGSSSASVHIRLTCPAPLCLRR